MLPLRIPPPINKFIHSLDHLHPAKKFPAQQLPMYKEVLSMATLFTESEIEDLWIAFNRITHNSPLLFQDQFVRAMTGGRSNSFFVERLFVLFSGPGHVAMTFPLFVMGMANFSINTSFNERTLFVFKLFDIGDKGFISHNDLDTILKASIADSNLHINPDIRNQCVANTLRQCGVSKDGPGISFKQFQNMVKHKSRMQLYVSCVCGIGPWEMTPQQAPTTAHQQLHQHLPQVASMISPQLTRVRSSITTMITSPFGSKKANSKEQPIEKKTGILAAVANGSYVPGLPIQTYRFPAPTPSPRKTPQRRLPSLHSQGSDLHCSPQRLAFDSPHHHQEAMDGMPDISSLPSLFAPVPPRDVPPPQQHNHHADYDDDDDDDDDQHDDQHDHHLDNGDHTTTHSHSFSQNDVHHMQSYHQRRVRCDSTKDDNSKQMRAMLEKESPLCHDVTQESLHSSENTRHTLKHQSTDCARTPSSALPLRQTQQPNLHQKQPEALQQQQNLF